ncbi:MAG TPA: hypothetical protein VG273_11600 [Bryobacteraceae bacterium]|nr:hypothetical protein [Bryobacteraceae bacterium]
MSKAFGIAFGAALVVIVILVWTGFATTKGNHLAPSGTIGKVRVQSVTDDVTFMVIDFNMKNDSDRDMIVHSISGTVQTPEGDVDGSGVAASDLVSAFRLYPLLGDQYNPVLKERDVLPAHQTLDRMVGIRFDLPLAKVESRKRFILKIQDVTGPVLELSK